MKDSSWPLTGSLRTRGIAIVCIAFLAGCKIPAPRYSLATSRGVVRAGTVEDVTLVSGWLDEILPKIRQLVPATRHDRPVVWVQEELGIYRFQLVPRFLNGFVNRNEDDRIHIRSDGKFPRQTLCHELVHVLLDSSWEPLPAMIEEGLCEAVSFVVAPERANEARTSRLIDAATYLGDFRLVVNLSFEGQGEYHIHGRFPVVSTGKGTESVPLEAALAMSEYSDEIWSGSFNPLHYGAGTWIVERILARVGFEGLHQLCREASARGESLVPADTILEAAELGPPETWLVEILEAITETELETIVTSNVDVLADGVESFIDEVARRTRRAHIDLTEARGVLRLEEADREIDLFSVPEFRDEILRRRQDAVAPPVP